MQGLLVGGNAGNNPFAGGGEMVVAARGAGRLVCGKGLPFQRPVIIVYHILYHYVFCYNMYFVTISLCILLQYVIYYI